MEHPGPEISKFEKDDWAQVWQILKPVFRAGETFALARNMTERDAHSIWVEQPSATFVATLEGCLAGSYCLRQNQAGPGGHVCNCGYVVSESARGKGVASAMCLHSQQTATKLGFRAMQYNTVVSTNEAAIHLWKKQGFNVIGVLPGAFDHPKHGFVDAFVMFKSLVD